MPLSKLPPLAVALLLVGYAATAVAQGGASVTYLATVGDVATDTVRLFDRNPGNDLTVCGEAASGTVALGDDYAFSYVPNPGFRGEDRYCVIACDGAAPAACDTAEVVVTVIDAADVIDVAVVTHGADAFLACVDLPFGGPYAAPQVRDLDPRYALAPVAGADPSCIRLAPVSDAPGTGTVEAIFCSATNGSFCRAVSFEIEQVRACGSRRFATDSLRLPAAAAPYAHCLADGQSLDGYDVLLDGDEYAARRSGDCGEPDDEQTVSEEGYAYDLRFATPDGPFSLDSWRVADEDHLGRFATFGILADSMSVWDPGNDWRYEAQTRLLLADGTAGDPGLLVITFAPDESASVFIRERRGAAGALGVGAVVELASPGWHVVELVARDSACGERQAIYLPPPRSPRVDTVDFVVRSGAETTGLCVPLDDLLGEAPTSVAVLSDATRGALRPEDFRCFALATETFTGRDTAVVVHCSSRLGLCDTTYMAFAVGQQCDSISLASAAFRQTGACDSGAGFGFAVAPLSRRGDLAVFVRGVPRQAVADTAGFSVVAPVGRSVITIRDEGRGCFSDFEVDVECVACAEPLPDDLTFEVSCGAPVYGVCLPIDAATVGEYAVTLDGEAVPGPWRACEGGVVLGVDARLGSQRLRLEHRVDDCSLDVDLRYACNESVLVTDTLVVGDVRSYCADPRGLVGELTETAVACETGEGAVELAVETADPCFDVAAVAAGVKRFCYVTCDDAGACDTTSFELTVNYPRWDSLAVVPDSLRAIAERDLTYDLVANDSLTGGEFAAAITRGPALGTATLTTAGTLTYRAPPTACGAVDSLGYELCAGPVCVETTVHVDVRCDPVMVYEGFSPNGDGVNDELVIVGLEELATFDLQVFSRWGTRVFETDSYDEGWDGTWENGGLPDGLYFYVLTYREADGSPGVTTGCTLLRR